MHLVSEDNADTSCVRPKNAMPHLQATLLPEFPVFKSHGDPQRSLHSVTHSAVCVTSVSPLCHLLLLMASANKKNQGFSIQR